MEVKLICELLSPQYTASRHTQPLVVTVTHFTTADPLTGTVMVAEVEQSHPGLRTIPIFICALLCRFFSFVEPLMIKNLKMYQRTR